MSNDQKKNPPPKPQIDTQNVRNNIPSTEHINIVKEHKRPTRPAPKSDGKK